MYMSRSGKVLVAISLLAVALAVAGWIEARSQEDSGGVPDLVDEVWGMVIDEYIDGPELDEQKLAEAAIRGFIEELGDPYTSYLSPEQAALSRGNLEGDFSGIGATITISDDVLTVVAPLRDSPAERGGMLPGDQILEVDGEPTSEMTLIEATLKIRGEVGTTVKLLVLHEGDEDPVELEIVRAKIEVPSVVWELLPDDIAYVEVSSFTDRTSLELQLALHEINGSEAKNIILDLRDNFGGVVDGAVSVASQFVDDGVIVYAIDSHGERYEWDATKGGLALDLPLAVLVNEFTASASEVVAGALQDHGRGPIIGTTTFGKGIMQRVRDLSNGGSLHVTFARWYTPDGHQIQGTGIGPDIQIEISEEDEANGIDTQLQTAIDYLKITEESGASIRFTIHPTRAMILGKGGPGIWKSMTCETG